VLVAEFRGKKVTERDLQNRIRWEKAVDGPVACQRLANGNTFIATRTHLLEVDPAGKEVFTHAWPGSHVMAAVKLRGGEMAIITNTSQFTLLDAGGKVLKSFSVAFSSGYSGFEVLPDGRVLVPLFQANKVVEFDTDGRIVWEAAVPQPMSASRLANGHTLVSSARGVVQELDRTSKTVWEYKAEGASPWRARRR